MKHNLKGIWPTREVWLDEKKLNPSHSQKYYNHSPNGFNWGYEGSGPAQLALAIVLELDLSEKYQDFKCRVISLIPQQQSFEIEFETKE